MHSVGFIGLGNVGGKLAGSLLRNKCDVMVRDLDRDVAAPFLEAGAKWADSPKAMAEACDIIITCLPSPAACAAVMEADDGVLAGLSAGKIWAEMSTTDAVPSGPVCRTRRPRIVKTGNKRSKTGRSHPAKIAMLPVAAR